MTRLFTFLLRSFGWYKLWLSTRVLILMGLVTTLLLGGLLYLAAIGFRQDKLSYIYDLQDLRTETMSVRLRSELQSLAKNGESFIVPDDPSELSTYALPRMPDGKEIFIAERGNKKFLIWRNLQGDFLRRPFEPQNSFFSGKDGTTYWLTSFGVFLGSAKGTGIDATNFKKRPAVSEFLKSRLTNGLVTVEDKVTATIAGFREIPETNIIIFVETKMSDAMAPLQKFIRGAVLLGVGVIALGILLTWALLSSLWRPVTRVAEITGQIAQGKYDVDTTYLYTDELAVVFSGLSHMAEKLKSREQSLIRLQKNLEQILAATLHMALANNRLEVVSTAVRSIFKTVERASKSGVFVHFSPDETNEIVANRRFRLADAGTFLVAPREEPLADGSTLPTSNATQHATLTENNAVSVPIHSGEKYLANLSLENYQADKLSQIDRVFLETLAASMAVAFENLHLREDAAIKSRLESELQTAQAVQANLLPEKVTIPGIEFATYYMSSEQTGGDWIGHHYDEASNSVYFYIGDVTGHGVASALLTGVACGAVYASEYTTANHELNSFGRSLDPAIRLTILANVLNKVVRQTGRGNLIMTMAMFCLNLENGELRYVSAGHTPLYVIKGTDKTFMAVPNGGSILGAEENGQFSVKETQLAPNDTLFVYTDGLVENEGPQGQTVKLKKLLKTLASKELKAQEMVDEVLKDANEKWQGEPGKDDVSVLILKYVSKQSPYNAKNAASASEHP